MRAFDRYNYLKFKHLERSPYVIWSEAEIEWSKQDNHRMLLIALDAYADEIQGKQDESTRTKSLAKENV